MLGVVTASLISPLPRIIYSPCSSVPICSIQSLGVRAQSYAKASSNLLELIHGLGLPAHPPMTVLGQSSYLLILSIMPICSIIGRKKKKHCVSRKLTCRSLHRAEDKGLVNHLVPKLPCGRRCHGKRVT